jgi:hypothetical protein
MHNVVPHGGDENFATGSVASLWEREDTPLTLKGLIRRGRFN